MTVARNERDYYFIVTSNGWWVWATNGKRHHPWEIRLCRAVRQSCGKPMGGSYPNKGAAVLATQELAAILEEAG